VPQATRPAGKIDNGVLSKLYGKSLPDYLTELPPSWIIKKKKETVRAASAQTYGRNQKEELWQAAGKEPGALAQESAE